MITHRSHLAAVVARLQFCCMALASLASLTACAPLALTAVGVGSAAGVQHTLNGVAYRTFTAPLPQVRSAAIASLNRMGIKVDSRDKAGEGEVIKAKANGREIEIEFDALTPNTTRMRTAVRNGLFMDAATSTEIILQTERVLTNGKGSLT
jgi:hypothetical protein